jgi:hypothetical protein
MGKLCLLFFVVGCNATAGRPACENTHTCGSSTTGGGTTGGGAMDMAVPVPVDMAMAVRDLSQGGKGFGDPCGNNFECASDICILAGIGGTCSRLCDNDPCPEGYGCYGVLGAVEPGQVANVCVPDRNQLCTPCSDSAECSTTSQDICYPFPSGGKYCARDCSTVSCPTGYDCKQVQLTMGGPMLHQCIPVSGACDCNATLMNTVKSCSITTPFGTCAGTELCNGTMGWGPCNPPSTSDFPDDNYKDDNCDGIDGEVAKGIFVAVMDANAIDDPTCGTMMKPCKSIGQGLTNSVVMSLPNIYVQAGGYSEVVTLQAGKNIYGGYNSTWQRAARDIIGHTVTITGALDATDGQYLTLKAHDLVANSTVADLVLIGPSLDVPTYSSSTFVVHAKNATLTLHNVTLIAGSGGPGKKVSDGTNYGTLGATGGMYGGDGGGATQAINTCDVSTQGGPGTYGSNSCGNTSGAWGGYGGTMDSGCDCLLGACACLNSTDCRASDGTAGGNGAQRSGIIGQGGGGGTGGGTCDPGGNGNDGKITNGGAGTAASLGSLQASGYWSSPSGGDGVTGLAGGGGGGGGGAGGCDNGTVPLQNSSGAGGGGGGAGGCAAISGGKGGSGGGSSFGVLAVSSNVTISNSSIQRGVGAKGGDGGIGGQGQSGGGGGNGGNHNGGSGQNGGNGGNGGHGGHGGGGAGGSGGSSYGLFQSTSSFTLSNVQISGGGAGQGGSGGASAPNAPVAERDGNGGPGGPNGTSAKCNFANAACN